MTNPTLKPCPFCGGIAAFVVEEDYVHRPPMHYIRCSKCGARTDPESPNHDISAQDWNRRDAHYDPLDAPMCLRDMAVILDDAASKPVDWATQAVLRAAAANARGVASQIDRVMPLLAKEAEQ